MPGARDSAEKLTTSVKAHSTPQRAGLLPLRGQQIRKKNPSGMEDFASGKQTGMGLHNAEGFLCTQTLFHHMHACSFSEGGVRGKDCGEGELLRLGGRVGMWAEELALEARESLRNASVQPPLPGQRWVLGTAVGFGFCW